MLRLYVINNDYYLILTFGAGVVRTYYEHARNRKHAATTQCGLQERGMNVVGSVVWSWPEPNSRLEDVVTTR